MARQYPGRVGTGLIATVPCLPLREIWSRPLPHLERRRLARWAARGVLTLLRSRLVEVSGLDRIDAHRDPFILVLNHSQRLEALLVPPVLIHRRGGKPIHFLADWNFRLVPLVGSLMRAAEAIALTRKPARPRVLDILRPLFTSPESGFVRAQRRLAAGGSVGVFPEGTVNRDARHLLRGHSGAAWLSATTGVPVVPAGIRFPGHPPARPVSDLSPLVLEIGEPRIPPRPSPVPAREEIRSWHECIMRHVAELSGKAWHPASPRRPSWRSEMALS